MGLASMRKCLCSLRRLCKKGFQPFANTWDVTGLVIFLHCNLITLCRLLGKTANFAEQKIKKANDQKRKIHLGKLAVLSLLNLKIPSAPGDMTLSARHNKAKWF